MIDFKINVTPFEAELVQKLLFIAGYSWFSGTKTIVFFNRQIYLSFYNNMLSYSDYYDDFILFPESEINFAQFLNEIEKEINN